MTEAEARRLMDAALATDDTPTIIAVFDKITAAGFGHLLDSLTWGFH